MKEQHYIEISEGKQNNHVRLRCFLTETWKTLGIFNDVDDAVQYAQQKAHALDIEYKGIANEVKK